MSSMDQVHKHLAAQLGSDFQCQKPCLCRRMLLSTSLADALTRQKHASKERILQDILRGYMGELLYDDVLSEPVSHASNPPSTHPNSVSGAAASAAPTTSGFDGSANQGVPPAASMDYDSGTASCNGFAVSSAMGSMHLDSQAGIGNMGASVGRPPTIRVVKGRETPSTPGVDTPLQFHNGIQAALASVLQHSAGLHCPQGIIRSCDHPSAGGTMDTVTVRLCPTRSKHALRPSSVDLKSCLVPGPPKQLYVPKSFDEARWSNTKSEAAKQLYHLLERLHELILPNVASVNLYYDADDGCIAFNRNNVLWYNAYADRAYDGSPQGVRLFNWYITVCHELAHIFRREHDEVFSDYLAHIALQHSRGFYGLCSLYNVSI